jgi:transcriptional antiterminator NusG
MKRWYAIQTYAGSELKVREELEQRLQELGLERRCEAFQVNGDLVHFLAPVEEVITSKSRRGRAGEYRIPYNYELEIESNKRINRGELLAVKPPRYMEYDAMVKEIKTFRRVILELTNRNEEVYKIPLKEVDKDGGEEREKRIRRDIRTGEKVPAGVPLTADSDAKYVTKVKGKVVQRDRIKAIIFEKEDSTLVTEEIPEKYLVKLKEGLKLRKGDLLEREDKIYSTSSGMVKVKEYKDKRGVTVQRIEKRRLFPGYIFGKLEAGQDLKTMAKSLTDGIKARFVGTREKQSDEVSPVPISEEEMKVVKRKAGLMEIPKAERVKIEVDFAIGEVVEIVEGPFADFTGEVVDLYKENEEVTVLVKIFGRETPVQLGFEGIEKL